MRLRLYQCFLLLALTFVLTWSVGAQEHKGSITGIVTDSGDDVLTSAKIELQPKGREAVPDSQGQFIFSYVSPGDYHSDCFLCWILTLLKDGNGGGWSSPAPSGSLL